MHCFLSNFEFLATQTENPNHKFGKMVIWHVLKQNNYSPLTRSITIGVAIMFKSHTRVFHDTRFCQIIGHVSMQWGWNPRPLDHQSNALPTEFGRNLLGRFLKRALFVSSTTSHVGLRLFLESVEHDFIKAMKIQASN